MDTQYVGQYVGHVMLTQVNLAPPSVLSLFGLYVQ